MPVAVSYPGVYIQEIPSGVHTIAGVSTSVTAFVGRTFRGPVNQPTTINSYADYQRFFGGLNADSTISRSVHDFFQNGGGQGVVVRVFSGSDAATGYSAETATLSVGAPQIVSQTLAAALAVANAAWSAAAVPGATAQNVADAASFTALSYRLQPTLLKAAQMVAAAVPRTGAAKAAADAAGAELAAAVTAAIAADATVTGAGWTAPDQLGTDIGTAATTLTGGWDVITGDAAQQPPTVATASAVQGAIGAGTGTVGTTLGSAASSAASAQGATGLSVMQAVTAAVVPAVAGDFTGSLGFTAANPGNWANGALSVSVDQAGISAAQLGTLLNVRVSYADPGGGAVTETFLAVSVDPNARANRLDAVLQAQSNYIRYAWPGTAPTIPANGGLGAWGVAAGGTASLALGEDDYIGNPAGKAGIYALEHYDLFNILVIPPDTLNLTDTPNDWLEGVYQNAAAYCRQRRAFLIIDPLFHWSDEWKQGNTSSVQITDLGSYGPEGENAAVYFPHVIEADPLMNGQPITMPPSGAIAGIYARTDAARGVWKAPAGVTDGAISGIIGLELKMTDADNGFLNPQGINALRSFPTIGSVVWGARTLKGADALSDDYKYVPVRRLVLYLEESLYRGTQWAVFEPNAEPLWASLRLAVGGFMNGLYRQGAFAGASAKDAYFVACDATTTTQTDIDLGIVNVKVGFAPLKPAEFVVLTIQQIAGQTAS
jgi:phage tail sheath protein FI